MDRILSFRGMVEKRCEGNHTEGKGDISITHGEDSREAADGRCLPQYVLRIHERSKRKPEDEYNCPERASEP